jgi:hypothetical protein
MFTGDRQVANAQDSVTINFDPKIDTRAKFELLHAGHDGGAHKSGHENLMM